MADYTLIPSALKAGTTVPFQPVAGPKPQVARPVVGAAPVLVTADPNAPAGAPVTSGGFLPFDPTAPFLGYQPPFTWHQDATLGDWRDDLGQHGFFADANGKTLAEGVYDQWLTRNGESKNRQASGSAGAIGGANTVTNKDITDAVNTYRATTEGALSAYKNPGAVTAPQPTSLATPITGQRVDAIDQRYQPAVGAGKVTAVTAFGPGALTPTDVTAALVSPADRLQAAAQRATQVAGTALGPAAVQQGVKVAGTTVGPAAVQQGTTVAGTRLDTSQGDQARAAIGQNLEDLQATARGEGAGMLAALARTKLGLAKAAQAGEGLARSARGSERRGALLNAQGLATEAGANALTASEAQAAGERQAATQAIGTQLQATRTTDVDVAAKRADLDQQRSTLQAQLDAAKASGDAGRQQEITTKLADLQRSQNELQATLDTTVNTQNTNRQQEINLKRADLDQQKAALQAQLDSARAANDQAAILSVQAKQADLDTQIKSLNQAATNTVAISNALERNKAGEAGANRTADLSKFNTGQINTVAEGNRAAELDASKFTSGQRAGIDTSNLDRGLTAETGNANRAQDAQKTTVDQGLAAQKQQEDQRVANERLKIDLQTAAQQAAQGLLNEAQREELIRQARTQQDLAERKFQAAVTAEERAAANEDRKFWANIVSGVVTTAAGLVGGPVAGAVAAGAAKAAGAARGGLVDGPRTLVGEGEHRELVIPIKGKLTRALEEALAIDAQPFAKPVPIKALMAAIQRSLADKSKGEPAKPKRSGHVEMLAAYNVRQRKAAN
jgi:hypothetical protein